MDGGKSALVYSHFFSQVIIEFPNCISTGNANLCSISKIKSLHTLKTRLDLECSSVTSNKHVLGKNSRQQQQDGDKGIGLSFMSFGFLHHVCLLNAGLESRLEYSRLGRILNSPDCIMMFVVKSTNR